ncbi:MAG: hypothetical protein AAFP92_16165 [Bacteroidota bacterium]
MRDIYNALTQGDNVEQAPFETNKDVFMLAACMGYRRDMRKPLPSGKKADIRLEVFSENDKDILKGIVLASGGDVELLENFGYLDIIEEYAYAGIYEVKVRLMDTAGLALWNFVESM